MTKEYITKNRAKQFVCGHCNEVCSEEPCEPSDCDWMAFIDKEPAADVIEKKHGYWIKRIIENENEDYPIRNVDYICSQCEGCWHEPLKYCPHCLAEMDLGESK